MNKKLKLMLTALLGFSAACSTVRNAPAKGEPAPAQDADSTVQELPRMVVMYGVRAPGVKPWTANEEQSEPQRDTVAPSGRVVSPGLDPVAEEPFEE